MDIQNIVHNNVKFGLKFLHCIVFILSIIQVKNKLHWYILNLYILIYIKLYMRYIK